MSQKLTSQKIEHSRTIGFLFLIAFITYGIGRGSIESQSLSEQIVGILLILINFITVFTIGLLLAHTIHSYNETVGNIYILSRIIEAILLSTIILTLPFLQPIASFIGINNDNGYNLAMVTLGLGSIPACHSMYVHNLLPSWLSLSGLLSYTILTISYIDEVFQLNILNGLFNFPMNNMDSSNSSEGVVIYALLLSGVWEVVFSLYLINFKSSSGITGEVEIVN